ncbi:hypothetical protein DID77_04325 [Candidatus Marinamargulisbacteria bacterium SCGC AG-439-L15]|nr:hypothetical protein DID77_04325 [Candidatus Marinamargulisbacteria bacterium SCGC AG-439-L15]
MTFSKSFYSSNFSKDSTKYQSSVYSRGAKMGNIPISRKGQIQAIGDNQYDVNHGDDDNGHDERSFDELLFDELEELETLPETLQESFAEMTSFSPLSQEQLTLKTKNFYLFGVKLIKEINDAQVGSLGTAVSSERLLELVTRVLFIGTREYGFPPALQGLIEFWKSLDASSKISELIGAFFYHIGSEPVLPLSVYRSRLLPTDNIAAIIKDRSVKLKAKLHQSLEKEFPRDKGKKILEDFNFGT